MSENGAMDTTGKKARKPRSKSNFAVLQLTGNGDDASLYRVVAQGSTMKGVLASCAKDKVVGELLVVCIRRKVMAAVQEVFGFKTV